MPPGSQAAGDDQTESKSGPGAEEAAAEGLTGDSQSADVTRPEKSAPEGTVTETPGVPAETESSAEARETNKPEEESPGTED